MAPKAIIETWLYGESRWRERAVEANEGVEDALHSECERLAEENAEGTVLLLDERGLASYVAETYWSEPDGAPYYAIRIPEDGYGFASARKRIESGEPLEIDTSVGNFELPACDECGVPMPSETAKAKHAEGCSLNPANEVA